MAQAAKLRSHFYHDSEIFKLEQQALAKGWQYVANIHDIPKSGQYLRRTVSGKDLFLQNCSGEYRAFLNVCSHRQSLLRCNPSGHGPIACPYHGWTYGEQGQIQHIPGEKQLFDFSAEEKKHLSLKQFRVEVFHSLLFVCLEAHAPGFQDFLESDLSRPRKLLQDENGKFGEFTLINEANWKVCLQNAIDDYHIVKVHPETYGAKGILPPGTLKYVRSGKCADSSVPIEVKEWDRMQRYHEKLTQRKMQEPLFSASLIFPYLTITSVGGMFVWSVTYKPINVRETEMKVELFRIGAGLSDPHMKAQLAFLKALYEQDVEICWKIQKGAEQSDAFSVLGTQEERVLWFQESYLSAMAGFLKP